MEMLVLIWSGDADADVWVMLIARLCGGEGQ
jgi:hypothetical protein